MKARLDYLKPRAIVDLKTVGNPHGKPVAQAVNVALANYRYHVQAAVYQEAAADSARIIFAPVACSVNAIPVYCARLPKATKRRSCIRLGNVAVPAPVAIGRTLPAQSGIYQIGKLEIEHRRADVRALHEDVSARPTHGLRRGEYRSVLR
jgi:hypothetical protein